MNFHYTEEQQALRKSIRAFAEGEILPAPRGSNGFGYDPIFYVRELNKTFAELSPGQKNLLSHRGQAFRRLASVLPHLS